MKCCSFYTRSVQEGDRQIIANISIENMKKNVFISKEMVQLLKIYAGILEAI